MQGQQVLQNVAAGHLGVQGLSECPHLSLTSGESSRISSLVISSPPFLKCVLFGYLTYWTDLTALLFFCLLVLLFYFIFLVFYHLLILFLLSYA